MGSFDRKQPPPTIPPKKKADFSNVQSGKSTTAPVPPPRQPAPVKQTYTVVPGDSLSKIAKNLLGSANRWSELYEANRAVVGDNPNLIKPGQVLTIPENPKKT
jgi:nucleoid-associated protein YgaU